MSGRLRITYPRPKSATTVGEEHARKVIASLHASMIDNTRGLGVMLLDQKWCVYAVSKDDSPGIDHHAAAVAKDRLNETFDRLRYAMENPDVAVSFTDDGTARLIATDDSGIDHETLFKIGRVAR